MPVVQYRTRPAKLICDIVAGLILSPTVSINFQTRRSITTNPSPLPKEKAEKETEEKTKKIATKIQSNWNN